MVIIKHNVPVRMPCYLATARVVISAVWRLDMVAVVVLMVVVVVSALAALTAYTSSSISTSA